MSKQYFVYMLQCSDNSIYTGITNNIGRRFEEHSTGLHNDAYTSTRLPVKLIWYELFNYILDAIAFEKQLKGWSRKKKLALAVGDYDELARLSKNTAVKSHASSSLA